MPNPILHLNEFVGKTITEFILADDATLGREVALRFDDGTGVSIAFRAAVVREARHTGANGEILREYPERPVHEWDVFEDTGLER